MHRQTWDNLNGMISPCNYSYSNRLPQVARYVFAATVFVGAYLLFQIQPLVGKIVTAEYGGGAGVWCVCLLFFQIALLGGYTLTLLLVKLPLKIQCICFAIFVLLATCILNVSNFTGWSARPGDPIWSLLELLTVHLALPCLLLSMISGVMQSWYARAYQADPYHLYSISNIGSLGALLLYPVAIEPYYGLNLTLQIWRISYIILFVLSLGSTAVAFNAAQGSLTLQEASEAGSKPSFRLIAWWVFLSALGCAILLTYTVYLTQDVAPVPLLWTLPLCLYLLTFVICFGKKKINNSIIFLYLGPVLWVASTFAHDWLPVDVLCTLGFIFCSCMSLNIEMVRNKPVPAYLPTFYLAIAVGGVLGAVAINFFAPMVFNFYAERNVIISFMLALCYLETVRNHAPLLNMRWVKLIVTVILIAACLAASGLTMLAKDKNVIARHRNFYGCLTVSQYSKSIYLTNGGIIHGSQFRDEESRREPTQYYRKDSGLGMVEAYMRKLRDNGPLNLGVIGLGAGTIAAYGQKGDRITFYELDKDVETVARKNFTFLADTPATVNVMIGDARKSLEKQKPNNFDFLVVDAFSSDAIPVHLLNKEAIELYLTHLKPDGALLVHISNRYLKLEPVVANIAHVLGYSAMRIDSGTTHYVAMTRTPVPLPGEYSVREPGAKSVVFVAEPDASVGVWTDDYNNVLAAILAKLRR